MSNPGAGFEYPPTEVTWLKRDALLFANSIGATAADELHFLYVSRLVLCHEMDVKANGCRSSTLTSPCSRHTQLFFVRPKYWLTLS